MSLFEWLQEDLRGETPRTPPTSGPTLRAIDKYVLVRQIGRGGMGIVFEAEDPLLKRRVALKIIRDEFAEPSAIKRLHREASIAAQLQHPNIVGVHEVGLGPDSMGEPRHYIVMDYVEGRTMAQLVKEGETPQAELIRMMEEVASAVAFAHGKGIVHRDLKLENVLVDGNGRPVLTDFGLARAEVFQTPLTQTDAMLGTPHYMAPEQIDRKWGPVGVKSDVYALGCMLYEILTGRPPFHGPSVAELFDHILFRDPVRPSQFGRRVAPDLEIICIKALEKEQARRYMGAREFGEDIARYRRGEPIEARAPSWLYRTGKRFAKRKAVVGIGGVALVVVAGIVALLLPRWLEERGKREGAQKKIEEERERREALAELGTLWMRVVLAKRNLHNEANDPGKVNGQIREAVGAVGAYVAGHPRHPEGYYIQAWGLLYLGELEEAERLLRKALALPEPFPPAERLLARVRIEQYGDALLGDPTTAEERHRAARGILEEATILLRRAHGATERWPFPPVDEDQVGLTLAEGYSLHFVERKSKQAAEYLRERFETTGAAEYANLLGFITPIAEEVIAWQTQALKRMPLYAKAYVDRARGYGMSEQLPRAIEDCTRALAIQPSCHIALIQRALMHRGTASRLERSGRMEEARRELAEAMKDVERVIKLRPNRPYGYQERAILRKYLGDYNGALDDLKRVLEIEPGSPTAFLQIGWVHRKAGNSKAALEIFGKLIERDPNYAQPYYDRGCTYMDLKRYDEAIRDFDKTLALDLKLAEIYNNRGGAYRKRGEQHLSADRVKEASEDWERAIEDLTQAIGMEPRNLDFLQNRASLYAVIGERYSKEERVTQAISLFSLALEDYSKVLSVDPQRLFALFYRAKMYAFLGELDPSRAKELWPKAKADLEKVRAIAPPDWPDREPVEKFLRRLEELSKQDS